MCGSACIFGLLESEDQAGEVEVAFVGDFDVGGVGFDDQDGFAEALDEAGIVGAVEVGLGIGTAEEVGLEDLRSLDGDEVGAVKGTLDGTGGEILFACATEDCVEWIFGRLGDGLWGNLLDGVGDRGTWDDGLVAVIEYGGEEAVDKFCWCAGAGGIVDGDGGCGIGDRFKGVFDCLPAVVGAAGAECAAEQAESVGVAEFKLFECAGFVVGSGDNDLADAWVVGEEFDGSLEDGTASEVLVELVLLAESCGGTCGGDDDAETHGSMVADWEGSSSCGPARIRE